MLPSPTFSYVLWVVGVFIGFTKVSADGLNPMSHPKADEVVPVESPYTIEWTPGTEGSVSICIFDGENGPVQNVTSQYLTVLSHSLLPLCICRWGIITTDHRSLVLASTPDTGSYT